MSTLWLRFPEDIPFPAHPDAAAKKRLEDIFSAADKNAPWNRALQLLSLAPLNEKLIYWHRDVPYFNSSALINVISGGAIEAVTDTQAGYAFKTGYSPGKLWALLASQWRIARFLQRKETIGDALAESIALGLVLQSLMLRLGSGFRHLPVWLAGAESVPVKHRKTVQLIQAVQLRRTHISRAWTEVFPSSPDDAEVQNAPEFFWNAPAEKAETVKSAAPPETTEWKGLSVCTGQVTGIIVKVSGAEDLEMIKQKKAPLILAFRRARPETTELFEYASAVLFAEGGILSHACTIARERNIPAITALGPDFFNALQAGEGKWFSIDGGTGVVRQFKGVGVN